MNPGRAVTIQALLGMSVAMGIGRFAYTPLMPVMMADGVLTRQQGAWIATANYLGYLIGAAVLTLWPQINSRVNFRSWTVVLIASEVLMVPLDSIAGWSVLRLLAGYASAVVFVGLVSTLGADPARGASPGIAFGGVGLGFVIMGSYALLLADRLDWTQMWLGTALISALLAAGPWLLPVEPESRLPTTGLGVHPTSRPRHITWIWRLLLASYSLEGLGYIIIGTFLVASVGSGTGLSAAVWIIAGAAAIPATFIYHSIAQRIAISKVLVAAYLLQTVGAVLPVIASGTWASIVCAVLYGGTFLGIAMMATGQGRRLPVARSAAALTAGYSVGQVLGPLVVAPVIGKSYTTAFLIAAIVIGIAGMLMAAVAWLIARHGERNVSGLSPAGADSLRTRLAE